MTLDHELTFLGVTLQLTSEGILLHQRLYTEDLLQEHSPHITARRRTTSGEPEHFQKDAPLPPDPNIPETSGVDKERATNSRAGFLWLSTRTRPDLAYSVSSTAQVLDS